MNQKCSSILLILAILSGVITTSYASQRRVPDSLFQLTFKNGFAVCDVTCTADYSTDKVVVNVTPGQTREKAAPLSLSRLKP